jgi:serine/threonine protein kinase
VAWQFGRYRMESLIARGGMGEVHRAYDTEHDRMVAIKLLADHTSAGEDYRARFTREARTAARLREPHVIPIHAYGEIDGRLYLDMRLVEGADLSETLTSRGPLSPAAAVDVIAQVASALDAAHAEGLVHRDIKPSNVILDASGFAYLVDFGIARSLAANADITGPGIPIGTVAYMAPERFASGPVDHRVDVYSLACMLFQCLTGVMPFTEENPLALMHAHLTREPPRPTEHLAGLSPAFDQVVATGMAKRPEQRYPSAGALAAAARHALSQPAQGRPARTRPPTMPIPDLVPQPSPRRPARRWWLAGAGAAVVAVLAVAALIWLPNLNDDRRADTNTPTTVATTTGAATFDLSVSTPLSNPECDGSYIVIVGSAVRSSEYRTTVQRFLDANPDAKYLHAPSTGCSSLRQRLDDTDIYSVYYGPFVNKEAACDEKGSAGGDAFVRRLDDTSSSDRAVSCG